LRATERGEVVCDIVASEAEVGDLDARRLAPLIDQHYVGGFEVAVNDITLV
jgi:hypothetical protein